MKTGLRLKPIHFLLIILLSAALLIGATFAAISLSGFRYTTYKTESNGDIRFIGTVDKQDQPVSGKVYFSDGSEAELERAGSSLTFKDSTVIAPDGEYIYKLSYSDGSVYTGTIVGMLRNGKGSMTFTGGDIYEGDFSYNKITGQGTYYYLSGDTFAGTFDDGKKSGEGTYTWAPDNTGKSDIYVGSYADDMRNGNGTYTWADGSTYVGTYVNDAKQGEGKLTFASGDTYEGTFLDDMRTGKGTYIFYQLSVKIVYIPQQLHPTYRP